MPGPSTKVRKLKGHEIFHEIAQSEHKSMITSYWLTLESPKEVLEGQIEETLRILFRNIDILRYCIKKENDEFWFHKMEEERIVLEVLEKECPNEVFHKEMHTSIDSASGPLWRAKYIINDKLKERNNSFVSDIIFTFNHAITDGFTMFNICNAFLKVLNDVIGGGVQNSYNFGQHDDGDETEELTQQRMEYLKKNPDHLAQVKSMVTQMANARFSEFFPVPENAPKRTKFIHRDLDTETNKKIVNVFKSKGFSFHSGFSAVANWVLMELFTENMLKDEEIDLNTFHMINMRRYWKKSSTIQLGPHVAALGIPSKTDKNVGSNFWDYAREFHKALKDAIDTKQGIDMNIAFMLSSPQGGDSEKALADVFTNFKAPTAYYVTTNMGNLSSLLKGRGNYVSIKWLARCTSAELMNTIMTHIFQTYEGRFLYGLGYSTHLMTDEIANIYVDKIMDKLRLLSNLQ